MKRYEHGLGLLLGWLGNAWESMAAMSLQDGHCQRRHVQTLGAHSQVFLFEWQAVVPLVMEVWDQSDPK